MSKTWVIDPLTHLMIKSMSLLTMVMTMGGILRIESRWVSTLALEHVEEGGVTATKYNMIYLVYRLQNKLCHLVILQYDMEQTFFLIVATRNNRGYLPP